MWGAFGRLVGDDRGAVAPTVALSLFALIGAGGIAFDYARLAAMDTELQDAADQAALAAATQLDRMDDAITRATDAITVEDLDNRLAANSTFFANDSSGRSVTIDTITFCSAFDDTEADNDDACTETTDPSVAKFVMVTTEARTANYALTPIVAAFSGTVTASAVAGVQSAICNVAPLMICAPSGATDYPTDADIGKGVIMKPAPKTQSAWAPGNYGLLDFGNGFPAAFDALLGHGLNGCKEDSGETEPGNKEPITQAINTRFDVYQSPKTKPGDCTSDGTACPAPNTRKDAVLQLKYDVTLPDTVTTAPVAPACDSTGAGLPGTLTFSTQFAQNSAAKGFPRDDCHIAGNCPGGNIGKRDDWNVDAYLAANHSGVLSSSIPKHADTTNPTRYDVYRWEEEAGHSDRTDPQSISTSTDPGSPKCNKGKKTCDWTVYRQCAFSRPQAAKTVYTAQKDRRIVPVIAANCDNLQGKGSSGGGFATWHGYTLLKVFDMFLVEPSYNRAAPITFDDEIYGEIVGPAQTGGGVSAFQLYSKTKPYLVR